MLTLNEMKLVYPAFSKHNFYFREHISKYILERGFVPLNPFMMFNYFLLDAVDRDLIRNANNNLVKKADAIWVFGQISDGVMDEIRIAKDFGKPREYFDIVSSKRIAAIKKEDAKFEYGLANLSGEL